MVLTLHLIILSVNIYNKMTVYSTSSSLLNHIDTKLYDNYTRDISGSVMNGVTRDIIDSIWVKMDSFNSTGPISSNKWMSNEANKVGFGVYDLDDVYGLNFSNGSLKLNQLYTYDIAIGKFPKLFQWYSGAGLGTSSIMNFRHGPSCHMEAVLQGHIGGQWGTGRINSLNSINWPSGVYHYNFSAIFDQGQYIGRGANGSYRGTNGTVHMLDYAGWLEDTSSCDVWKSSVSSDNWDTYSYIEGAFIHNMRFMGGSDNKNHDPSYLSTGISFQGPGEVATIGRVKTDGFNGYGLRVGAGTPMYVEYISSFSNTMGGIHLEGGALSTHRFNVISCDDNPCIFKVTNKGENRSGATVSVGLIKNETGARNPLRGQIIMEALGDSGVNSNEGSKINITIENYQYACKPSNTRTHALFVVQGFKEDRIPNDSSSAGSARIHVGSMLHWNVDHFVHDIGKQQVWRIEDGDYSMTGFDWNGRTGLLSRPIADGAVIPAEPQSGSRRLGIMTTQSSWDEVPEYDETFGNVITPNPPFGSDYINQLCVGIVPSEISTSQHAQAYALAVSQDYRLRPDDEVITWTIMDGPASINSSGFITPSAKGLVQVRASLSGSFQDQYLNVTD